MRQLPLALLAAFAPVDVVDGITVLGEVSGFEVQHLSAPSTGKGRTVRVKVRTMALSRSPTRVSGITSNRILMFGGC